MHTRREIVAAEAQALGCALAGAAPLEPLPRAAFLAAWLADGRAGEMAYLADRTAVRIDPRQRFPWARTVLAVAYPYQPPPPPPDDWRASLRGRIAAYTLGIDYHERVRKVLRALKVRLAARFPGTRYHPYVDTGPVLEREWAARAGLGWIGRNTLLLHQELGSYVFLGELFTDLEVEAVPLPADRCGTCRRCIDACPTGALAGDYTMDPRRCISYLTIEHRSAIPPALRPALDNWIFGCDLCQEVCPWNGETRPAEGAELLAPHLPTLLGLDAAGFHARFRRTAVMRAKRRGLLRNAAVVLGNTGNPAAVPSLVTALADPEPLVRGHAAWALGRLGGGAARRALEAAARTEPDDAARGEMVAARGACA